MTTATAIRPWYEVTNAATGRASIYVYDDIGEMGVTARAFVAELDRIKASAIDCYINSGGGDPFTALAILNALRRHKATVTTICDGLAASAASIIFQAGNRRVMAKNAQLMIHQASGMTLGRADEHEKMADMLGRIDEQIADVYAARAGGTRDGWRQRMKEDTYFTAEEAVAAGLADEITQYVARNSYTSGRIHNLARQRPTAARSYVPTDIASQRTALSASLNKQIALQMKGAGDRQEIARIQEALAALGG